MKHFKKTMVVAALAAGMFIQSTAHAAPVVTEADAILRLLNFEFTATDGAGITSTVTAGTHVTGLVGTNSADDFSSLDGTASFFGANSPLGADLSITQACVGSCVGENNFTTLGSTFFAGTNPSDGAFADANLADSAIAGLGGSVGAEAETRATSALETGFVGDATSNIGLIVSLDFTAGADFDLGVSTDFDWTAHTFVDALALAGTSAQASTAFNLTITETLSGALAGFYAPGELNNTFASLNAGELQGSENVMGHLDSGVIASLTDGTRYTLNLRHATQADVLRVAIPEPSMVAILGLGMLAMLGTASVGTRRRK